MRSRLAGLRSVDDGLDFVRVDESAQIRLRHDVRRGLPSLLGGTGLRLGAKDTVQLFKRALRPDDKSTQVTPRRQRQQTESVNRAQLNARNVSKRSGHTRIVRVYN